MQIERITKSIRRIDKFLKKNPKHPTPGKIHSLRTSTRRLEAAVAGLGLGAKRGQRRLLRELRSIRKRAGKIRDMDVLTGLAASLRVHDNPDKRDELVQVLEHLGARRAKQVKKIRAAIAENGRRFRKALARVSERLEYLFEPPDKKAYRAAEKAGSEVGSYILLLSSGLRQPAHLSRSNLHPYRLQVKELRYLLQFANEAESMRFVSKLGEVKDAIGEWHDWEELLAIATDVLRRQTASELLRDLQEISDSKFERALSLTNEMRATYAKRHSSSASGSGSSGGSGKGSRRALPFPAAAASAARATQTA